MKPILIMLLSLMAALSAVAQNSGQSPATGEPAAKTSPQPAAGAAQASLIGEVTAVDAAAKQLTLKDNGGQTTSIRLDDTTVYLRVPPGEKTLEKATKITLPDIGVGDRVLARGRSSDDKKTVYARQVVVMTKADISKKRAQELEEWRQRSIAGSISAIDPQSKEITLQVRGRQTGDVIRVVPADGARFRRYAPDSIKFSDAKPSSFAEIKVGDQLRALGEKSADGLRFQAEEIVSGSFQTVGGIVTAVNPAANEIQIRVLGSKQLLTVVVDKDSILRRIPPQYATILAQKIKASAAGPTGGNAPKPNAAGATPAQAGTQSAGGTASDGSGDLQEVLDRLPAQTLAQMKQDDVVVVSNTVGANASRVTAIAIVSGIDALLNTLQGRAPQASGRLNLELGLPATVLDLAMRTP